MSAPVTVQEFKTRYKRDFLYGTGTDKVTDDDIANAFSDASAMYNPGLFSTADGKVAFLYAAAHFLVINVQASGGLAASPTGAGVDNQADGVVSSKGAGGLNVSYVNPPDIVIRNPNLLQFWKTDYGQRYLSMLVPKLRGAFGAVQGPRPPDTEGGPFTPFSDG